MGRSKKQKENNGAQSASTAPGSKSSSVWQVARKPNPEAAPSQERTKPEKEEEVHEQVKDGPGDFAGASAASRVRASLHQCEWCGQKEANYSWMCYVDKESKQFAEKLDPVFEYVKTNKKEWKFDSSQVEFVCIYCKGKYDKKQYLQRMKSDPSRWTPTAEWNKKRNKSGGRMTQSQRAFLLKRFESQAGAEHFRGTTAMQVYEAQSNDNFRKGSDWVSHIGPDVYLLYGCSRCHIYPLKSSDFLRTAKMSVKDTDSNIHDAAGNEWRSPCCGAKWTWGVEGKFRLLVLGGNPESKKMENHMYVYIGGNFPQTLENQIQFLKGCELLKTLGGRDITKNNILEVIHEVNCAAESRLSTLPEVEQIKVINPQELQNYEYHWRIVCQDRRLSCPHAGKQIRVINLKRADNMPDSISVEDLECLVALCASTLDIENCEQTTANKKIAKHFADQHAFQCGRAALQRMNAPLDMPRYGSAS